MTIPLRLAVLISGRGSNLEAICKAIGQGRLEARIEKVVSSRAGVAGLSVAKAANLPARVVASADYASREAYDDALLEELALGPVDLVVLAGFMRVLGARFVAHWSGRLINIHPSLLPDFPGLYTHRRALEAGVNRHGATVHLVSRELDAGPILAQAALPVQPHETAEALARRVLTLEHRLLPATLREWQRRIGSGAFDPARHGPLPWLLLNGAENETPTP